MSDEEFEDADDDALEDGDLEVEDLDDEDLDDDLEEDAEVLDIDGEIDVVVAVEAGEEPEGEEPPRVRRVKSEDDDEDGLDLDEELHPDDVEAPLDALLQEKTAAATLEDDEDEVEEEEVELDDRGEGPTKIMPRRADEFLCSSCFLVLPRNQLSDEARMLCRDCA